MSPRLPTGTVTFLFTDIEGSTRLLHELGAQAYAAALLEHRRVVRAAVAAHDGVEVDTQGDAFFVAFPTAAGAVRAAARVVEDLEPGPIRLRMGVHTGTPYVTDEGYVGDDVHRAARIAACGHGGQVLVSSSTAALLPVDPLPGVPRLHDLGAHRLKDLSAAEHLHQLGHRNFPPLKSLHRTNLPVPATPFTGRDTELGEVLDMLGRDDVRLLTLTGTGGTGKTRLALQAVAALAEHYPGGVYWVPLASLRDPSLVLGAASHALGTTDDLASHVGDRAVLLLLDNVEQVVDVAPDLVTLLAACPRLRLVVTSREVLRVQGEHVYPVPPLARDDAVELFVARARAVEPAFTPTPAVADLCARLDRLPLSLELAAARTRVLTVDQLLDRLAQRLDLLKAGRGADPRQQSLRATIAWSHDLLQPDEQRLFARLAAFRGGCRLESAEQVCDADLDVLQSLVDKSLVRVRDAGRFWLLETIREYAAEQLATSGEEATLRARHAEHFLALAEQAAPHLRDRDAAPWLARLDDEHDNLRAALEFYEERPGERLRLAAALSEFWLVRGFLTEGRRVLTAALAAAGDEVDPSVLARGLDAAAAVAVDAGDARTARSHAAAALAIHDRLGEDAGRAESLWILGYVAVVEQDWTQAQQALEESASIFRRLGDDAALLAVSRSLAWSHHERGDLETARRLHEQTLALATALDHPVRRVQTLGSLSAIATEQGRLADAVPMLRELHETLDELGDLPGVVQNLARIVRLLVALDEPATAAVLLACADEASRTIGGSEVWTAALNDESRRWLAERLDETACLAARERGSRLSPAESARLGLELAAERIC